MNQNYLKIQEKIKSGKRIAFDFDITTNELKEMFPIIHEAEALDHFYGNVVSIIKKNACMFIVNPTLFAHCEGMALNYVLIRACSESSIPFMGECEGVSNTRIAENSVINYLFTRNHAGGVIIPSTTPENVFSTISKEKGKIVFVNGLVRNSVKFKIKAEYNINSIIRYSEIIKENDTDSILGVTVENNINHVQLAEGSLDAFGMKYLVMSALDNIPRTIIRLPLTRIFPTITSFDGKKINEDMVYEKIAQNLQDYLQSNLQTASSVA